MCNCKTSTSIGLTVGVARCNHCKKFAVNDMQIIRFFFAKGHEDRYRNNIFEMQMILDQN